MIPLGLTAGILLPEATLHSEFFAILAAFVAINTVMYAALAIAKIVPMVHVGDLLPGRLRRSETRSIHPHTTAEGTDPSGAGQSGPGQSSTGQSGTDHSSTGQSGTN